jgi:signal peptidase II
VSSARFALIAGSVALADQMTKLAVVHALPRGRSVRLIAGALSLHPKRNHGFAFRTLAHLQPPWRELLLVGLPLAVLGILLFALRRGATNRPKLLVPLAMVIGGALGNLIDRIRDGYVIDFLHIGGHQMPTLNLADLFAMGGLLWFSALASGVAERSSVLR